ncbi:hypothetical protein [Streptomyces sp. NPDC059564]|uniref:hypothetical protein n=1 Tax=Streptomyces sp. NPDC059564 TaxID=3346865 RepID=UPI0036860CA8
MDENNGPRKGRGMRHSRPMVVESTAQIHIGKAANRATATAPTQTKSTFMETCMKEAGYPNWHVEGDAADAER